ncbi:MAG: sulfur-carrier protein [Alphaproteobacteria bacterium]|nr:sulfur-carrier protein [Alphaproteobacteria bacterium]
MQGEQALAAPAARELVRAAGEGTRSERVTADDADRKITAMAQVHFTSWLRELVPDAPFHVTGATVGEALTDLFAGQPHVRSYVLDDQGCMRKHVCIFADGRRLAHDVALGHPIRPDATLYVMQALSGG